MHNLELLNPIGYLWTCINSWPNKNLMANLVDVCFRMHVLLITLFSFSFSLSMRLMILCFILWVKKHKRESKKDNSLGCTRWNHASSRSPCNSSTIKEGLFQVVKLSSAVICAIRLPHVNLLPFCTILNIYCHINKTQFLSL